MSLCSCKGIPSSPQELWALLHFIMPDKFDDWQAFDQQHDMHKMEKVSWSLESLFKKLKIVLKSLS